MNTELERIQKYMDGQLLAPAPRGLCHRIAEAIEGRDSAINELAEENGTLRAQVDDLKTAGRQARDDATAALDLVSRIRIALNDNGKRMQDELLSYCRELATLPARVADLESRLSSLDCRYAGGGVAEVSGSHCPADIPCDRCMAEHRVAELEAMLNAALDDDWEQPDLAAYRVMRSGWKPE